VVALWRVGDDAYRLAASLVFDGDTTPVALTYDPRVRDQLGWTSAPGKRGEEGSVTLRSDHRVVVTQR